MSLFGRLYAKVILKGAGIRLRIATRVHVWRLSKRLEAIRQKSRGSTLQVCILDTSGSMFQSLSIADLICSAVSKNARRHGDEVALLASKDTGQIQVLAAPSRNYDQINEHKTLTAAGSTVLAPAISWLNNYCSTAHLTPIGIIFTDAFAFDETDVLRELRKTRDQLHGFVMMITPVPKDNEEWARIATEEGTLEVFEAGSLVQTTTQMRHQSGSTSEPKRL